MNNYRCTFNRLLYNCEATTASEARSKAQRRLGLSDTRADDIRVVELGPVEVSRANDPLTSA